MLKLILLQIEQTPVPHDIPLELPLPEWLLVGLLIVSFLAHILFVNLMLGGSILTLWAQVLGLRNKEYDILAHEIARTITVNKSMAVVLGVAPLLSINTLYTVYFYSANTLTGLMWVAIIPLVVIAFLLTYLHKYTWHQLEENKALHISIIGLAVLVFLFIPLIFLTNINLMLFPEKWGTIRGFVSAMTLDNVFPRYLHFLFASLAVTGLFLFWYIGRRSYPFDDLFKQLTRYDIQKKAYSLTLAASVAQFIMGPLVLITLPSKGIGYNLILTIFSGATIALFAMWWMWKAITGPQNEIGKGFGRIAIAMTITVLFMGTGRHIYRANALAPHQKLMAAKTSEFLRQVEDARANPVLKAEEPDDVTGEFAPGIKVFKANCAICHKVDEKLVGPPVKEMAVIYGDDLNGLKDWIRRPGKKREDYPQMPGFPQLSDSDLENLTKYILSNKQN